MANSTDVTNFINNNSFIDNGSSVVNLIETKELTISGSVGQTINLYVWAVDDAGAVSVAQIGSNITLGLDTDAPLVSDELIAGGLSCFSQDVVPFVVRVTDVISGVDKYTVEINGTIETEYFFPNPIIAPDNYIIKGEADVGSAAGSKNIIIKIYDRAGNVETRTHTVNRSSQSIVWNYHTAARSTTTPFLASGNFEAYVTNSSLSKINGFFPTTNYKYSPVSTDFDTSIGAQTIASQQYTTLITESDVDAVLMYVQTDSSPTCYGSKWASIASLDYSSLSIGNPILDIKDSYQREYTNTLTNNFKINAQGGSVGGSIGSTYPNGDLIVGYMITESATSPGNPPTFNQITNKFEDSSGVGWTVIEQGESSSNYTISHTFANSNIGYKTVYLWVATMGHSGIFAGISAQTFSASTQIYYIDDFQGPTLTNPVVNGEVCTLNSGTIPDQIFDKPSEVTSTSLSITGTLTDDKTKVVRWIIGNFGSPPAYYFNYPGSWNVLSTPTQTVNFSANITLPPPNSVKSIYLFAVDSVGNMSTNKIRVALNDPAFAIPTYGTSAGQVYKFEGKSSEHTTRKTIASMFGDGVQHTGFISKRTPDVQANRVHKLSEYRGLRVQDMTTDAFENLPAPSNPLKFSDFLNKKPRLEDLRISPYVGSITVPVNIDVPEFTNDIRNLALTVDIDTGDVSTPYVVPNNDLVDIDARWFINFIPIGSGSVIPQTVNVTDGKVNSFNFSQEGVYLIIAYDSFGNSISTTYRIYASGSPLPPIQDPPLPPVIVPPPGGGGGGGGGGTPGWNPDAGTTSITVCLELKNTNIVAGQIYGQTDYVQFSTTSSDLTNYSNVLALISDLSIPSNAAFDAWSWDGSDTSNFPTSGFTNGDVLFAVETSVFTNDKYHQIAVDDLGLTVGIAGQDFIEIAQSKNIGDIICFTFTKFIFDDGSGGGGGGGGAGGTTPVTIPFYIDQVALAVDAALCVDRSGSYVPGFSNAMYGTLADTLVAISKFSEDINGNTDARFAMIWYWNPYPGGILTGQDWTTDPNLIDAAVAAYKDNSSGGLEPKLEVTARAAMGAGNGNPSNDGGLIGDWRPTALKLILLYSDEPDSPQQQYNGITASNPLYWQDPTNPNYFINRLLENEVALVLFDAGVGSVASLNDLPLAISQTSHLGSTVETLSTGADPAAIVAAVESVFDNYKNGLSFDIEPDLSTPAIFKSKTANTAHGSSTVPIAYNDLIPEGNRKKALFDVLLDNDEIYNVGTNYINTYVTIKNSSGIPIARKLLQIIIR